LLPYRKEEDRRGQDAAIAKDQPRAAPGAAAVLLVDVQLPRLDAPVLVVWTAGAEGCIGEAKAALATHLDAVRMAAAAGARQVVGRGLEDALVGVQLQRNRWPGDARATLVNRHVADGLHPVLALVVADLVRAQARAAAAQLGRAIEHRLGAFGRLPAGQAIRRPE